MTLLIPTVSENTLCEFLLGKTTPGNQVLRLYVNNVAPGDSDVAATYTEMSTLGYAAQTLTKSSWTIAQNAGVAEGSYAQQAWTFTAGSAVTVYGYFVTDATSGLLLWAERFASAVTVQNSGDQIKVTPKFTFSRA
jgi:hypothetical protein